MTKIFQPSFDKIENTGFGSEIAVLKDGNDDIFVAGAYLSQEVYVYQWKFHNKSYLNATFWYNETVSRPLTVDELIDPLPDLPELKFL